MMRKVTCAVLLLLSIAAVSAPVFASTVLGDTNIEPVFSTFNAQYVEALTKITVTASTTIQSVSMYLQYTGSDGSQCLKFGIYADNGGAYGQSSPLNEPLIAATHNGYCFKMTPSFGPAWETWALQPSDYLTIPNAGIYWLAVLPRESFGNIYHFTYTGVGFGYYSYTYGYFMYGFPASYALGFPPVNFGTNPYQYGGYLILPYNSGNAGEYNAPYSFYVAGT
jgi:hypothetical protein